MELSRRLYAISIKEAARLPIHFRARVGAFACKDCMTSLTRLAIWDPRIGLAIERLASHTMSRGADALTLMVGQSVGIGNVRVTRIQLSELAQLLQDPEARAVGVFIAAEGDLPGRFLLLLSHAEALALASLLVGSAPPDSADLDRLARSALGEVGNQLSAMFLNSAAQTTRRSARPSPPVVLDDMAGAVVDLWLTAGGRLDDYLLIIDATFMRAGQETDLHFLFLPEYVTLRAIARDEVIH